MSGIARCLRAAIEGGTDGWLTAEATMAKRKEIAADIRADAEKIKRSDGRERMLRLAEVALTYEKDPARRPRKSREMADKYVQGDPAALRPTSWRAKRMKSKESSAPLIT